MSYRAEDGTLAFAATYVILEKGTHHVKLGPAGRPELWFLLGRATKPNINIAAAVRDMFMPAELPRFRPKLSVGGAIAHYSYEEAGEIWSVPLLGYELCEIDFPEALDRCVASPLRAAAVECSIQL
jgi:hypothetical protein